MLQLKSGTFHDFLSKIRSVQMILWILFSIRKCLNQREYNKMCSTFTVLSNFWKYNIQSLHLQPKLVNDAKHWSSLLFFFKIGSILHTTLRCVIPEAISRDQNLLAYENSYVFALSGNHLTSQSAQFFWVTSQDAKLKLYAS